MRYGLRTGRYLYRTRLIVVFGSSLVIISVNGPYLWLRFPPTMRNIYWDVRKERVKHQMWRINKKDFTWRLIKYEIVGKEQTISFMFEETTGKFHIRNRREGWHGVWRVTVFRKVDIGSKDGKEIVKPGETG